MFDAEEVGYAGRACPTRLGTFGGVNNDMPFRKSAFEYSRLCSQRIVGAFSAADQVLSTSPGPVWEPRVFSSAAEWTLDSGLVGLRKIQRQPVN